MDKIKKLQRDIAELERMAGRRMIIPDPELAPEAIWLQEMLEASIEWRKEQLSEVQRKILTKLAS